MSVIVRWVQVFRFASLREGAAGDGWFEVWDLATISLETDRSTRIRTCQDATQDSVNVVFPQGQMRVVDDRAKHTVECFRDGHKCRCCRHTPSVLEHVPQIEEKVIRKDLGVLGTGGDR